MDSHEGLPVVDHDRRRLEAVEFVPFQRAIQAKVAMIMTAHVMVPRLDDRQIASFSPTVIQRILKAALGYSGVVVSDDLGMKAVSADTPLPEAAVNAVLAGCDVVLLCNSTVDEQVATLEALIRAAESGVISPSRIDDALRRQHAAKAAMQDLGQLAPVPLDVVGCAAHQRVSDDMARWL